MSIARAHDLLTRAVPFLPSALRAEVVAYLSPDEPPDTLPAPPEPATSPGTPAARRRSSDSMQAVRVCPVCRRPRRQRQEVLVRFEMTHPMPTVGRHAVGHGRPDGAA